MRYVLFKYFGRPILAVPLDSGFAVLLAGFLVFPAFTLKRKIFKYGALILAVICWVGRLAGLPIGTVLDRTEITVLSRIKLLCPQMEVAIPIWSLVLGRDRMYFRLFDAQANQCGFVKFSWSEPGRSWLEVEAKALQSHVNAKNFTCPKVIALEKTEEGVLLLTSVLPSMCTLLHAEKSFFPYDIYDEIQSQRFEVPFMTLRMLAWYQNGMTSLIKNTQATSELCAMDDDASITLAPAHGDFGSENFFVDPMKRIFLIDWEHYSKAAPVATDAVSFWIGQHHRAIQRGQPKIAKDFVLSFKSYPKTDLLLALVYLTAFEVTDAKKLVTLWKN